jgi:hypothetical protein
VRTFPLRTIQLESLSNVAVTGAVETAERPRERYACLSFVNNDRRVATAITFHFNFYDNLGNQAGDSELVRSGRFTQGADIEGTDTKTNTTQLEDCAVMPYHDRPMRAEIVYVKSVTYEDGTIWNATGVVVPDHLPAGRAQ